MKPEIIGMIGPKSDESASKGREVHVIGGGIDPDYIAAFSKASHTIDSSYSIPPQTIS